jgi:hypothetical protein
MGGRGTDDFAGDDTAELEEMSEAVVAWEGRM